MDDNTLKKVQGRMLTIAKEIKKICDKNDIPYFLVGGTLIGAIRHKGFIPWDDDMDLGMLRSDYERFVSAAQQELPEGFFLQTLETDDEYGQAFAKVRLEGTLLREINDAKPKKHQGIWVDIFPYDNLPSEREQWEEYSRAIMDYRYTLYMKSGITPWRGERETVKKFKSWLFYFPYRFRAMMTSRNRLIRDFSAEMNRYGSMSTEYVCQESGAARFGKYPAKRAYLTELIPVPFEDTTFLCPKEYDTFLREIYGDYMKLPPVEQRQNYHSIIDVKY